MLMAKDYQNLKMDLEGSYSLSHKDDADKLSILIKDKYGDIKIMDATSGIGGNSISFGTNFTNVISIEQDLQRFSFLQENLKKYNVNNTTFNGDFLNYINMDYDLIFIDPPWGGPKYKLEKSIRLFMNNNNLREITKKLKENNKIIVWKLPFNYDLNDFNNFNYQIHKIKNYLIIIIE